MKTPAYNRPLKTQGNGRVIYTQLHSPILSGRTLKTFAYIGALEKLVLLREEQTWKCLVQSLKQYYRSRMSEDGTIHIIKRNRGPSYVNITDLGYNNTTIKVRIVKIALFSFLYGRHPKK